MCDLDIGTQLKKGENMSNQSSNLKGLGLAFVIIALLLVGVPVMLMGVVS